MIWALARLLAPCGVVFCLVVGEVVLFGVLALYACFCVSARRFPWQSLISIIPGAFLSHLESRRRRNRDATNVVGPTRRRRNFGPPLFPARFVASGAADVSHQPLADQPLVDQHA